MRLEGSFFYQIITTAIMANRQEPCKICKKRIITHENIINCSLCTHSIHSKCLPIYSTDDIIYAKDPSNFWTCPPCLQETFPFNTIEANNSFIENAMNSNTATINLEFLSNLVYDPFEQNYEDSGGVLDDIDPDRNFLGEIGSNNIGLSKYCYCDIAIPSIQNKLDKIDFALFHVNIRSTPRNFNSLLPIINSTKIKFNTISLTETWLKSSNADVYGIPGYSHEYLVRESKIGGGSSIYIREDLLYKKREDLCYNDDDCELLWIELDKKSLNTTNNIIIGNIYRRPGSDPT